MLQLVLLFLIIGGFLLPENVHSINCLGFLVRTGHHWLEQRNMLVTKFHIHGYLYTLTSPMWMQSGALAHKGKAEVWSMSRIMLLASSFADVWVHLLLTCGGNWTGPHWLPEGPWVKLWQCTKVSLDMALPICMHYSSKAQEPINMPPGLPPAEASPGPLP